MKGMVLAILVLVIVLASLTFAQSIGLDDRGNPNDPRINERANACFEGGTLDGKCVTDAEWNGGWYLIRFQQGILTREAFPDFYAWILPPIAVVPSTTEDVPSFPSPTPKPL